MSHSDARSGNTIGIAKRLRHIQHFMKHAVTKFRSPKIALKELERFIRDGRHLKSGKPFKKFGDAQPRRLRGPADAMSARICASSAFSVVS
jgi:hypothetical protein